MYIIFGIIYFGEMQNNSKSSNKRENSVKDVADSKHKADECFLSFSGVRSEVLSI